MAKEVEALNCDYYEEVVSSINAIANSCVSFKIGKTGETIEDRGNQKDYQEYEYIQSLFSNGSSELVSHLEESFINKYIDHPKNDNKKDGDQSLNDNMTASKKYHLYVVWR